MTGHEYPAPHILASPPGTQAPAHYINYTPDTNEVHGPGSLAPQDRLNYSLLPHDDLRPKSMGAGVDWGRTVGPGIANPGMPPGSEQGGRYSPTQALRDNTFSPGQPPIAQHPFGTGPGPQIQAAGPDIRDFDQRVAFVAADRFSVPGRFNIGRMRHVEIDVSELPIALLEHHDFCRRLDDVERVTGQKHVGDAARHA